MRINTDDKFEYRAELYEETANLLGEGTRVGGIDAACEFTRRMLQNLDRAKDHPDMTPELAELLSTPRVELVHRVETELDIKKRSE